MERELLMAGIGGQGVQLAAQLLARAATRRGLYAQLFGSYGGMMRGGNTDATLIIGNEPVQAPPTVATAWSALVMHHEYAEPTLRRLRLDGVLVVNTSVVELASPPGVTVLGLPATDLAIELGSPAAATMVALGAYAAVTQILAIDDLIDALPDALPSYRSQHIAGNARALEAGAGAGSASGLSHPAWTDLPAREEALR